MLDGGSCSSTSRVVARLGQDVDYRDDGDYAQDENGGRTAVGDTPARCEGKRVHLHALFGYGGDGLNVRGGSGGFRQGLYGHSGKIAAIFCRASFGGGSRALLGHLGFAGEHDCHSYCGFRIRLEMNEGKPPTVAKRADNSWDSFHRVLVETADRKVRGLVLASPEADLQADSWKTRLSKRSLGEMVEDGKKSHRESTDSLVPQRY